MKKMKHDLNRVVVVMALLLLTSLTALAQTVVSGRVTNQKDGSGIPNVTVSVKGTATSTQTNGEGNYSISVPNTNATLVFTSVGFTSREVKASAAGAVSLTEAQRQLEDVVVVAYGTRKKTDLTGSVTQVTTKDFQKGNIASSEQLLQGKVAGLQITTGGGSAGGGSTIRIRGTSSLNASNDPLIVIDGVPVEGNSINGGGNLLNTINPNDIESMSVLKDASATALYGSRATNGVLIITTKKGAKGKVKFNFNTTASIAQVPKMVDVLTGDQVRSIVNGTGKTQYINMLGTANTDWQKLIYRQGFGWDNNLSASGAIMKVLPFRISGGYFTQEGNLLTDKFNRASASLNLSPKLLNDHLTLNYNLKFANTKYRHADGDAVGAAASFDPTQAVNASNHFGGYFEWLNTDGSPVGNNGNATNPNPLSLLKYRNNTETVNRLITNLQADYKFTFLPELHFLANVGIDNAYQNGNDTRDSMLVTAYTSRGNTVQYKQDKKNLLAEFSFLYNKEIGKNKFDFLLGHGYQAFATDIFNFRSYKLNGDTIAGSKPVTFPTDKQENRLESYFTRLNYAYDGKYLVTATLRRDASSRFAKANRVGYFPSVALAWRMNQDFFPGSSKISDLKLRLGWGITGQQDGIGNYAYLPVYSMSTSYASYQFGNNYYTFLRPSAFSPNLKWETTTTQNAGLDFGFLKNRITGSIDIYSKKTKDLLSVIDQAPGQNLDVSLLTNVGEMKNNGVEFTLNTTPIRKTNFSWDFGFNVTYQKVKIAKLYNIVDPAFPGLEQSGIDGGNNNNAGIHQVGYAPYTFYLMKQVYDANGRPIEGYYEDFNRDGKIDDRYYYPYNPAPSVFYGLNTQVTYRKITLGLAGHGTVENYLYNNFASRTGVLNGILNGSVISNGSTSYLKTGFVNQQYKSDYYLENASFFRLDNINLGYNFGRIYRNKANLRISGSVQNVFVITKYSGLDPENSSNTGVDKNIYPRPRIFSLNANIDF